MSEWTDEMKDDVVLKYQEMGPTPENSMELVEQLAEEFEKTVNGVRIILTKRGVYVKKTPARAANKKESTPRVSKQDSIDALTATIESVGGEVNSEILSKLTGKAAIYFKKVIDTVAD